MPTWPRAFLFSCLGFCSTLITTNYPSDPLQLISGIAPTVILLELHLVTLLHQSLQCFPISENKPASSLLGLHFLCLFAHSIPSISPSCLFFRYIMQILPQGLCTCYYFMDCPSPDIYMAHFLISLVLLSNVIL